MGCTGCNDGCFDESVQLAQGPTGETGAAASTELLKLTDSTDILEIGTGSGFSASEDFSYLRTSIEANTAERTQTTNSYSTNHIDKNIPADILVNVGDILRLEFSIIGDFALESSAVSYDFKILFGSLTVLDTVTNPAFRLNKGWYNGYNGVTMTLDLIVSAVNQMTPVIRCKYALGIRTSRYTFTNQNFNIPLLNLRYLVLLIQR
jgi:hypothetical protein